MLREFHPMTFKITIDGITNCPVKIRQIAGEKKEVNFDCTYHPVSNGAEDEGGNNSHRE